MIETEFNFVRGNTYSRDFTINEYSKPIDEVYFNVKLSKADNKPVISKKIGHGITVVEETEKSKTFNLIIDSKDTDYLKSDIPYYFDLKIVTFTDTEPIKKTIITGTMMLDEDVTRVFNER